MAAPALTPHSLKLLGRLRDFERIVVGQMVYVRVRQLGQMRADYFGQVVGKKADSFLFRAWFARDARGGGEDLRGANEAYNAWAHNSTPLTILKTDLESSSDEAPIMVFMDLATIRNEAWKRRRHMVSLLAPRLTARRGGRRTRRGSKKRRCTRRN